MAEHLDRIHIRDLRFRCIIGVFPEEREKRQDVTLNLTLYADLRAAGVSDELEDTVDYKAIKQAIMKMGEASRFKLIEALARTVTDICFDTDPRVQAVRVAIDKPGALRFARSVAVEIYRQRNEGAEQ